MSDRSEQLSALHRWVPVLLLFGLFAQLVLASPQLSLTVDEPLDITSGYACLITGDFRLTGEHPPFLKLFQALPLLWQSPALPDPTTIVGWEDNDLMTVARTATRPYPYVQSLALSTRLITILVSVLLGALLHRWTARLAGQRAGIIALLLYCFDPNILAHACLVTSDLGATLGIFAATYMFWRWIRQSIPQWKHVLSTGVVLGAALAIKHSTLVLGLVFAAYVIYRFIKIAHTYRWQLIWQSVCIVGIAGITVWAIYGFEIGTLRDFPINFPLYNHIRSIYAFLVHTSRGHAGYLNGSTYWGGKRLYFITAFTVKTPLLTLVSIAISLVYSLFAVLSKTRNSATRDLRQIRIMVPLVFALMSLNTSINIGYRHILPVLPFIFMLCGEVISKLLTRIETSKWRTYCLHALLGLAVLLHISRILQTAPWYLSFFNVLVGGSDNGSQYLVDSNLDWEQYYWALSDWISENDVDDLRVVKSTSAPLTVYGIDAPIHSARHKDFDIIPWAPEPATYAIGVTNLQGPYLDDPDMYAWFLGQEPVTKLGGDALFIYEVLDAQRVPDTLVICTPHDDTYIKTQYGVAPENILRTTCVDAVSYQPDSGLTHYLLPIDMHIDLDSQEILQLRLYDGPVIYHLLEIRN